MSALDCSVSTDQRVCLQRLYVPHYGDPSLLFSVSSISCDLPYHTMMHTANDIVSKDDDELWLIDGADIVD